MATVAEILRAMTPRQVQTIDPAATVYTALRQMAEHDIGALMVVEGDAIRGIFTERDYARKMALQGRDSARTPVREVMTLAVLFVSPQDSSQACMQLMIGRSLRHLPVLEQGKLVGMISMRDLVKDIIAEQQHQIEDLERYIHGGFHALT